MKGRKSGERWAEIEKIFEYSRRRGADARPAYKPVNYTFDGARKPDMMLPERPRADVRAAESAMRQIKEFAGKAREMYRERRAGERPVEARDYVRHQLALGMLDAPTRRMAAMSDAEPESRLEEAEGKRRTPLGVLRRRRWKL